MDRILEKKSGPTNRTFFVVGLSMLAVAALYVLVSQRGTSRLRVDPSRMTTAQVEFGQFREYFPFDGRVEPVTSVYLDIEEGGRVEEIFVEGGQYIKQGEPILRFSNATLQRNSIDTETRLVENLNALRNTQFNRAQSTILLKDQLLDLEYRIVDVEATYRRHAALVEADNLISQEQFEKTRDELNYLREKRALLKQRIEQEDILNQQQLEHANSSIERLNVALGLLTRMVDALEVKAPISGYISSIDAEIGQNINRGQRIGQIDILDEFKIAVSVDQYYLSRVDLGTQGRFELDGKDYSVVVQKIYPEVVNDTFTVDVDFSGEVPANLRRGQRVTVEMSFGEPSESLMIMRGGFQQQTSGRWVYLISEDRESARRATVRLGRQNPRFVEVLEGLRPGDWIVTSSYDAFNEVDELSFTEPIGLIN